MVEEKKHFWNYFQKIDWIIILIFILLALFCAIVLK